MRVEEINPTKRPELFFLPRDTGEVDGEGAPIIAYDVPHEEVAEASGKAVHRKCTGNRTQKHHIDGCYEAVACLHTSWLGHCRYQNCQEYQYRRSGIDGLASRLWRLRQIVDGYREQVE